MKDEQLFKKKGKSLEAAFFAQRNERLLRELQEKAKLEDRRNALRAVVKTKDPTIIEHLLHLGVGPESILAVGLVPLAAVSWADGRLEEKERKAILKAASEHGVEPGTAHYAMLEVWLKEKPGSELIDAWKKYARAIYEELTESERLLMRDSVLGKAREVAEAAGGLLGLATISSKEKAMLEELGETLS